MRHDRNPPYITNKMVELPQNLVLDFTMELQFLRDLKIEFFPYFGDREFNDSIRLLIDSVGIQTDSEYQIAAFTEQTMANFFNRHCEKTPEKIPYLEKGLIQTGQKVLMTLIGLHVYIGNVFPYKCIQILNGCTLVLQNHSYMNYMIELEERPFIFRH